jgi:hypothetical protein
LSKLIRVGRISVERPIHVQNFVYFQFIGESAELQLDADDRMERVLIHLRVMAENGNRAPVGMPQACDAFDGGGFTCPIRAEHSEYFAFVHVERDVIYRLDVAVIFFEVR